MYFISNLVDEEVDDEDFERLKKMIEAKQKKNQLQKPDSHPSR
jgi:hypothetical protein